MNRTSVIKSISPQKVPKSDPTSTTNVLKCFMRHHKRSLEELKKKSNEMSEKMEKTEIYIAEKNQENAQLKKQLQDIKEQLENVKDTCNGLSKENYELKEKYMSCHKKYIELEISYDTEFTNLNANMVKQKADLESANRLNAQLRAEHIEQQQEAARIQAVLMQKESQLIEIKLKADELQAYSFELKAAFDEYKKNMSLKHEHDTTKLAEEVKEQASTIRQLIQNNEERDVELQLALSNLKKAEEYNGDLLNRNNQLSNEVSDIANRMRVEVENHNKKTGELNMQIVQMVSETKRYQSEIAKLVETNNTLKNVNLEAATAMENEMAKANQDMLDLKMKCEQLQKEHLDTTKTLLAEKADLEDKLQALKEVHEANIVALEAEIRQKEEVRSEFEQKVAELERQKN
ncbi:synaptonemal complex protein 1-like [Drosophila navojoa]|uniref:synaptonemal complex protein 1-like n=1 Tax=Drosophila navojoa TaxID=7232 RepID=UPI0011BD67B8|nr:synaptonemal complex protein 1-like [Drosophila navojoa]